MHSISGAPDREKISEALDVAANATGQCVCQAISTEVEEEEKWQLQ